VALLESEGAASVLRPGFHMRPLGSSVTEYSTRSVSPKTSVQLEVPPIGAITLSLTVTGSPDPGHLEQLHRHLEGRSIEDLLRESAGASLGRAASGLDPVQLLSAEFRSEAQASIVEEIEKAGLTRVSATIDRPDETVFLDAAIALVPRGEGWRLRQAVSEAIDLKEGRAGWKLTTAMGLIDESEKLFSEAEKNYLDALSMDPAALPPMTQLIGLYTPAGLWEKLSRILDAALLANPDSLQHINWMAMALLKTGDFLGAEQVLKHGLDVEPDSAIILANLGGVYLKQNKIDEALGLLERAVEVEPSSPQALFNLGSALASLDRFENAVEYLERAEQAGSRSRQLFSTLAVVHRRLGNVARGDHYDRLAAAAR
jgi:tetratricopeptide (TPR) repeat protein